MYLFAWKPVRFPNMTLTVQFLEKNTLRGPKESELKPKIIGLLIKIDMGRKIEGSGPNYQSSWTCDIRKQKGNLKVK